MKLKIVIEMDNAALSPADEAARYSKLAARRRDLPARRTVRDINGNRVGEAKVTR